MKRLLICALLVTSVGLAACDGNSPTATVKPAARTQDPGDPIDRLPPIEPIDPIDPGGGGGCQVDCGPTNPPVIEYRISVGLYRDGGDMKAYTRFERGYNGSFSQVDASNLSVHCYVNGSYRDGETESNAGYTHITFGESYQYGKQITCNHSANSGAYTASTSYTM